MQSGGAPHGGALLCGHVGGLRPIAGPHSHYPRGYRVHCPIWRTGLNQPPEPSVRPPAYSRAQVRRGAGEMDAYRSGATAACHFAPVCFSVGFCVRLRRRPSLIACAVLRTATAPSRRAVRKTQLARTVLTCVARRPRTSQASRTSTSFSNPHEATRCGSTVAPDAPAAVAVLSGTVTEVDCATYTVQD